MTQIITKSVRVLTITFDDGLKHGSEIACNILARYGFPATFYLVTGWVEPVRASIKEPFNANRSHGDWRYWRSVRDRGHELGSHTFSHFNARGKAARLFPWLIPIEYRKSLDDLKREAAQPSYTLSLPWNAASERSKKVAARYFSACLAGSERPSYNLLAGVDRFSLVSWAPKATATVDDYREAIQGIPEGGWLVIQLHSLDGEGWEPISSATFDAICDFVARRNEIQVANTGRVIKGLL